MLEWLNNSHIYFLQETHYSKAKFEIWNKDWSGDTFFSGNITNSEGLAILVNRKCNLKLTNKRELVIGRLITAEVKYDSKTLTSIKMYGHNTDDTSLLAY